MTIQVIPDPPLTITQSEYNRFFRMYLDRNPYGHKSFMDFDDFVREQKEKEKP